MLPACLAVQTIIRNRIVKCQYKIDDGLTPEAKDLVSQPAATYRASGMLTSACMGLLLGGVRFGAC